MRSCKLKRSAFLPARFSNHGFTLVELMITLTVAAILLVLSVPSFRDAMMNARMTLVVDALFSSLNFARATALEQNTNTEICPLGIVNSTVCGQNWALGWIVVSHPPTGAAALLRTYQTAASDPVVTSVSGVTSITFSAMGLAMTQSNFVVCDSRSSTFARSLMVLPTGFVQSSSVPGQSVWDGGVAICP